MSLKQTYTLEYLVKMTGGPQAASQLNSVNKALGMNASASDKSTTALDRNTQAQKKSSGENLKTTRSLRGLTFGLTGLVSSGVEAIGMWGIYQDAQTRVTEAQKELTEVTKTYGAESNEATKATREVADAERALNMVRRNTILSGFDMVTWITLTVNGLARLRQGHQLNNAVTDLATAANQRNVVSQQLMNASNVTAIGALQNKTIQLGRATAMTEGLTVATSRWAVVGGTMLKVLGPIGIALAAGAAAAIAYQTNFMGIRDIFDDIGVAIGNALPFLTGFLNKLKELALAFPNLGKMKEVIFGKNPEEAVKMSEELAKGIEQINASAGELIQTLAMADKGERGDLFSAMGIKGGAKNRFKETLNEIENFSEKVKGMVQSLSLMRKINIMEKIGFDVPDSLAKKMAFTMEDRLKNIFKGKDIFDELGQVFADNAKKGAPAISSAVAGFIIDHPEIISNLKALGLSEEAALLETMMKEEMHKRLVAATSGTSAEVEAIGDEALGVVTQAGKDAINAAEWEARGKAIMEAVKTGMLTVTGGAVFIGELLFGKDTMKAMMDIGGGIVANVWQGIQNAGPAFAAVGSTWSWLFDSLIGSFQTLVTTASAWGGVIASSFEQAWSILGPIFRPILDPVVAAFDELARAATEYGKQIADNFIAGVKANMVNFSSTGLPLGGLILGNPPAYGDTGDSTPTPENTGANKAPATQDWVTWQQSVEEKIGFVWTKATAFVNYINTSFTSTIPTALQTTVTGFGNLANFAVSTFNTIVASSAVTVNSTETNFSAMHQAITQLMSDLASHWSKMCNSMIANAKAAANGIIKELNRIPKKIVTVHETRHVDVRGEGGLESAASGKFFTVNGERTITVGDNPGGRESIAFIPHNNPGPTLEKIARMFGSGEARHKISSGGGTVTSSSKPIIVNNQVFLDGVELRHVLSRQLAKNQSAFK